MIVRHASRTMTQLNRIQKALFHYLHNASPTMKNQDFSREQGLLAFGSIPVYYLKIVVKSLWWLQTELCQVR